MRAVAPCAQNAKKRNLHPSRFELLTSSLLNARSTTELRVPLRGDLT